MPTDAILSRTATAAFVVGATAPPYEITDNRARCLGYLRMRIGCDAPYMGEYFTFGAWQSSTEGSPSAPSLVLDYPGVWTFRWVVAAGNRSITVYTKQVGNQSPRPSITLLKDASIGLAADVTTSAASSTGWIAMTASFVATAVGAVHVELRNNGNCIIGCDGDPCYFDRISVT